MGEHRTEGNLIVCVIVTKCTTPGGTVSDPHGSQGTARDGWAVLHGPQAPAGDKRRLGRTLTLPTCLGAAPRLVPDAPHAELECPAAEQAGPAVRTRCRGAAR